MNAESKERAHTAGLPKLTPKQIETLQLIADGKVRCVRTGAGSWRIMGASPTSVGRLMQSLKLAARGEIVIAAREYYPIVLTDAGRESLARATGEAK